MLIPLVTSRQTKPQEGEKFANLFRSLSKNQASLEGLWTPGPIRTPAAVSVYHGLLSSYWARTTRLNPARLPQGAVSLQGGGIADDDPIGWVVRGCSWR